MAGASVRKTLKGKQRVFVEQYLLDLNATQAAIRAGYSQQTADVQGPRLLEHPQVKAAIAAAMKARSERTGITQDRVLRELELLSFSDLDHYVVDARGNVRLTKDAPPGAIRALSSIRRRFTTTGIGKHREVTCDVEIKLWDKPGPLKLAGQHVGLFKELGDKGRPMQHVVKKVTFGGRYRPDGAKA